MGDKGSVIIADSGRGVEKGCFQILLDVADFRCVLPHTVKHKADMLAVQFHKLRFHKLCWVVVPRNPYPLSGGAYGFKHEVYNLVKPVTVKLHVLFENVVVDIVLDDFPVYINCALCCRFRSFPFRRRSRFSARRGVRGKDRNGMGT